MGHRESECWAKHGRPSPSGSAAVLQAAAAAPWLPRSAADAPAAENPNFPPPPTAEN